MTKRSHSRSRHRQHKTTLQRKNSNRGVSSSTNNQYDIQPVATFSPLTLITLCSTIGGAVANACIPTHASWFAFAYLNSSANQSTRYEIASDIALDYAIAKVRTLGCGLFSSAEMYKEFPLATMEVIEKWQVNNTCYATFLRGIGDHVNTALENCVETAIQDQIDAGAVVADTSLPMDKIALIYGAALVGAGCCMFGVYKGAQYLANKRKEAADVALLSEYHQTFDSYL